LTVLKHQRVNESFVTFSPQIMKSDTILYFSQYEKVYSIITWCFSAVLHPFYTKLKSKCVTFIKETPFVKKGTGYSVINVILDDFAMNEERTKEK
jgi:hypothetical protein